MFKTTSPLLEFGLVTLRALRRLAALQVALDTAFTKFVKALETRTIRSACAGGVRVVLVHWSRPCKHVQLSTVEGQHRGCWNEWDMTVRVASCVGREGPGSPRADHAHLVMVGASRMLRQMLHLILSTKTLR